MGIHGLMKLLSEECPGAIKEQELENYTGRKIAIDASMAMYQFLIAVRSSGPGGNMPASMLTNEAGEVTSHIQGMFNRTIKMMTSGIKPVYVFDGKPPQMKGGELAKRMAKRAKAEADLASAKDAGDIDDVDKFSRRLVKVSRQHNEDCKELLRLMGVPVVNAPCEAEAQCAELAKNNKVYATATEDMDALTFSTPKLVKKLTFSQSKENKQPIIEIDCAAVLLGLELTKDQFVDLCILCGCDYCGTIKGIGPKTALKLIRQHKSLENIIEALKKESRYEIPPDWYEQRVRVDLPDEAEDEASDAENEVEASTDPSSSSSSSSSTTLPTQVATDENEAKTAENPTEEVASSSKMQDDATTETENKKDEQKSDTTADGGEKTDNTPAMTTEEEEEDPNAKYEIVPPLYVQARMLFHKADVTPADQVDLRWVAPDEAGLRTFLVERMGFNTDRVSSGIKKLKEAQQQKAQQRMDSFFKPMATTTSSTLGAKRKADGPAAGAKGKLGAKGGAKGKPRH